LTIDDQVDPNFRKDVAIPYFNAIFNDIASRSHSPKKLNKLFIDNVGFFEFAKLPGIICDRFFSTFEREELKSEIIYEA
jgi:hypothetical protein